MHVCFFVPFLHPDTPKPQIIPKDVYPKNYEVPHAALIGRVLNYRNS